MASVIPYTANNQVFGHCSTWIAQITKIQMGVASSKAIMFLASMLNSNEVQLPWQ